MKSWQAAVKLAYGYAQALDQKFYVRAYRRNNQWVYRCYSYPRSRRR